MADANYVCSLDEKTLKKAKKELGEDPKQRLGAVQTFREWILQQKHIRCDTDTLFLLRFLRCAKFSQLRARTLLENYLKSMVTNKDWCTNIDMHDPGIKAFLKIGYFMMDWGKKDSEGRTVCVLKISNFDPSAAVCTKDEMMKAMVGLFMAGFFDEMNQVNGNIYLFDAEGYSIKHSTFFSIDDMKRNTKMWQNAFPARYKGFNYYNMGPIFEGVMTLIKPVLSKKWQERMKMHSTMESVYKKIEKPTLPVEYLPDDYKNPNPRTIQDFIDSIYEECIKPEVRDMVLRMSDPEHFWIDMKEKDTEVPQESFRKLNVD